MDEPARGRDLACILGRRTARGAELADRVVLDQDVGRLGGPGPDVEDQPAAQDCVRHLLPLAHTRRIGPGYCATSGSEVSSVMPSTTLCATRMRSNGSRCSGGRAATATACSPVTANSR